MTISPTGSSAVLLLCLSLSTPIVSAQSPDKKAAPMPAVGNATERREPQCARHAGRARSRGLLAWRDRWRRGEEHRSRETGVRERQDRTERRRQGRTRRAGRSADDLHHHRRGCRGPVHRRAARRHDGEVEAAGARLRLDLGVARRAISREPEAARAAESRRRLRGRRHDHGAERRTVRAFRRRSPRRSKPAAGAAAKPAAETGQSR